MLSMNLGDSSDHILTLRVQYNTEVLEVDVYQLIKRSVVVSELYHHINGYLNTIPEEDQKDLFTLFKEVKEEIINDMESAEFAAWLKARVKRACKIFDYERWMDWFRENSGNINIPEGTPEKFIPKPPKDKTEEKTYTVANYIDFAGLNIFCRAFFPLYAEFWTYSKRTNLHPQRRIFRLFMGSNMDIEGCALDKLKLYLEANNLTINGAGGNEYAVIEAGLSDDDIVDHFAAEAIFTKMFTMDFINTTAKPVTHIYRMVEYDGTFKPSNGVYYKARPKNDNTSDDDYSIFEGNRRTTNITMGQEATIQTAMRSNEELLSRLGFDPSIATSEFYLNELKNMSRFLEEPLDDVQKALLGWFINRSISPMALEFNEDHRVVELMLLAKTCLYMDGQEYIGSFLGSVVNNEGNFMNTLVLIKNTLSKALVQELMSLAKYTIYDKNVSAQETDVLTISRHIVNGSWQPLGYVKPEFLSPEGFLLAPDAIHQVVVGYAKYTLGLGL